MITRRTVLQASGLAAAPQIAAAQTGPLKVLSTVEFEPAELAKLTQGKAVPIRIDVAKDREAFRKELRDADIVYGGLSGADLDFAPKVKWVQSPGAGVESADPKFMASPILFTNMARIFAPGIAETAMGLLLCLTRGITKYYMPQFAKRQMKPVGTVKSPDHWELGGRTIGLVGFGGIGYEIGRRAHFGFDMKVLATDAKPMHKPEWVEELHDPSWFMEMVPRVDVLVSAAPSTPKTRRMFNESVFRKMQKHAIFLGMSRGELFDDMALVKALKEGWIGGAGLDVFPQEPPPADHPIFDAPNVVMTAHTSGWGPDRQRRLVDLFSENLRRYSLGMELMNVVDKGKGY